MDAGIFVDTFYSLNIVFSIKFWFRKVGGGKRDASPKKNWKSGA